MNIKEAKEEIRKSVEIYLDKDEFGSMPFRCPGSTLFLWWVPRESERRLSCSRSPRNRALPWYPNEINCVSETPEYNKSVREFDVATLDRLKRIDVTEDFSVWKQYAYGQGIHAAHDQEQNLTGEVQALMELLTQNSTM